MTTPYEGITCAEVAQDVTSYLEGALTGRERDRFENHCRVCLSCRRRVEQSHTLVGWLANLEDRSTGPSRAEKERLTALFREHGFHLPGRPKPRVPLGSGNQLAAPGDHLVYFWESEQDLAAMTRFVAAGATQGETCILLGHDEANERLRSAIACTGLDAVALQEGDRLRLVPGKESADALFDEIRELISLAVDRGAPLVRILGNLGWGRPGWPADREILRLEARLTNAARRLPVVVMCAYDIRQVPGSNLFLGGIECHPLALHRNVLVQNQFYVPADEFLAPESSLSGLAPLF
ncbi:MAG: MEDS domain-containing protein [Acidobacteriota bacterium]